MQISQRKSPVCSRCNTIMYTGNKDLNHRKGVCADGVAQKLKSGSADIALPDWPQPQGIFSIGRLFNPSMFLFTIRNLYEKVMERTIQSPGDSDAAVDYTLEDEAFSRMLASRTKLINNHTFFLLYADLELVGNSCESLISEIEGRRYLRIDCL